MKRWIGWGLASVVGALVATAGCVDLRELNPCRSVLYAYCERAIECSGATQASVDDCAIALSRGYRDRVGANVSAANACPTSAGACIDKIEGATCGRAVDAPECGEILANRVSLPGAATASTEGDGGSSGGSDTAGRDGSSDDAKPATEPLFPALPYVLELVGGTLVACATGYGCRSSTGSAYGGVEFSGSVSFDAQGLAWGVTAAGPVVVSPGGTSESLSTSAPLSGQVLTLHPERVPVFVSAAVGQHELLRPVGSSLTSIARVPTTAPVTGVAATAVGSLVVSTDAQIFECASDCASGTPFSGVVHGSDVAGTYLVVTPDGTTLRFTDGAQWSIYEAAKCLWATQAKGNIVCLSTTHELYVGDEPVPDARDVHIAATDGSVVHWVTTSNAYRHAPL